MDRRLGFRLQSHRLRAIVGHGVVSTGARTPALFGFQSPGDYATFNSNHTPDGTLRSSSPQCRRVSLSVRAFANLNRSDHSTAPGCVFSTFGSRFATDAFCVAAPLTDNDTLRHCKGALPTKPPDCRRVSLSVTPFDTALKRSDQRLTGYAPLNLGLMR